MDEVSELSRGERKGFLVSVRGVSEVVEVYGGRVVLL